MKKIIVSVLLIITTAVIYSQNGESPFNFGYETIYQGKNLPDKWFQWGTGYSLKVDTAIKHSGKNSVLIQPAGERQPNTFGCIAYSIPAQYEGREIEVKAYMKLLNVTEGPIGLMLRIDGSTGSLQFDNMQQKRIMGSSDWTQYSVKRPYPEGAKTIYIGAILSGKGQLWVDDFELLIDGVKIENAKKVDREVFKAELDKEYDKGSGIQNLELTDRRTGDLKLLGLVWGFLKYYHPAVAAGNFNWDYELFRILPRITAAESSKERDNILVDWIKLLGAFEKNDKSLKSDEEIKVTPDLSWITGSGFSDQLASLLLDVKNAKRTGKNYYISLADNVKNPVFANENGYPAIEYPDAGFRLLSLYRYWNIIQYFYPYKYLIKEDWNNILAEFIPEFVGASDATQYRVKILGLISKINDSHANIPVDRHLARYIGMRRAPYEVRFIEDVPVITRLYEVRSGFTPELEKGDVLVNINGKPVEKIISERLLSSPGSNPPAKLRYISRYLLNTNDSILNVEFRRGDHIYNKTVKTFTPEKLNMVQKRDTCFKLINNDIAYLYPGTIKNSYLPAIMNKVNDTKGFIIDLRCYPSEFIVFSLSSYLMPEKTSFATFTRGSIENPGLFIRDKMPVSAGGKNQKYYKGKVVILVNETSISQSEYTTMAFRAAPGATVIGSTTAGADGNVSSFPLPGGINTTITGIGVYYPDGGETQRIGIIPDIELKPTLRGFVKNQDELLDKAIEVISK